MNTLFNQLVIDNGGDFTYEMNDGLTEINVSLTTQTITVNTYPNKKTLTPSNKEVFHSLYGSMGYPSVGQKFDELVAANTVKKAEGVKCAKCGGSGKIDWTEKDGGVCYKCEGQGYIGEMPADFNKDEKVVRRVAKQLLYTGLKGRQMKGQLSNSSQCIGSTPDALWMIENNIKFQFKYGKDTIDLPAMEVTFGNDEYQGVKTNFTITLGGAFIVIKANKVEG